MRLGKVNKVTVKMAELRFTKMQEVEEGGEEEHKMQRTDQD